MIIIYNYNKSIITCRQRLIASAKHQCEAALQLHREELKKAKQLVEAKREARLEASRAVDEDSSVFLFYFIKFNQNGIQLTCNDYYQMLTSLSNMPTSSITVFFAGTCNLVTFLGSVLSVSARTPTDAPSWSSAATLRVHRAPRDSGQRRM